MTTFPSQEPSLESVFNLTVEQLLEMDPAELRHLLAKVEILCRWLRGTLHLKTKKGDR